MTIVSTKAIRGSSRSAHQQVEINDQIVGEVWREQARVIVSNFREPLRQEMKWRWFAKVDGETKVLGRSQPGFAGPGFPSKNKAIDALEAELAASAS